MKKLILILIPALFLYSCSQEDEEKVNDFFHAEVEGTQIPILVKGNVSSNKIILFANGGPGLTAIDVGLTNLAKWEENIETEYAMAFFDQRGTGNTYAPIDTSTITLKQFSDDMYAVIKVIKHHYPDARVYLMAHSFGGLSAADYLLNAEYKAELAGWICVNGHLVPKPSESWKYRRTWLAHIAQVEIDKGNDIAKWEECQAWLEKTPVIETDEQKDQWRDYVGDSETGIVKDADASIPTGRVLKILFASNYNLFPAYMSDNWLVVLKTIQRHYLQENYLEKIEGIDIPSLLIWGEYDDLVPFQIGEEAHDILKAHGQSELVIMKDAGHEPFLNDPEGYARIVKDWVEKN